MGWAVIFVRWAYSVFSLLCLVFFWVGLSQPAWKVGVLLVCLWWRLCCSFRWESRLWKIKPLPKVTKIRGKAGFKSNFRYSKTEFLNSGTIDILGWIILCSSSCPVHCRQFSSIPGFSQLDVSSTTSRPICDNRKCLRTIPNVHWGDVAKSLQLKPLLLTL